MKGYCTGNKQIDLHYRDAKQYHSCELRPANDLAPLTLGKRCNFEFIPSVPYYGVSCTAGAGEDILNLLIPRDVSDSSNVVLRIPEVGEEGCWSL